MTTCLTKSVQASVLDLIGNTPLVALSFPDLDRTIYAKAEFLNPSGSIKDRFASYVVEDARKRGLLGPDSTIVECSSGNTGIALAMVGTALGYPVRILMSDSASAERRKLIEHYGGSVETFNSAKGYGAGIELSRILAANDPRIFLPSQFENPLNSLEHEEQTAREILAQVTDRKIDAFVSGYGTGGTITGCGRGLRAAFPDMEVVAMEPAEAAMLSGEAPCCHLIEGISGGYLPPLLDAAHIDQIEKVSSSDAMRMARQLAKSLGMLVGPSSGANVVASLRVAQRLGTDSTVVTILCDRADRYYSTHLFPEN